MHACDSSQLTGFVVQQMSMVAVAPGSPRSLLPVVCWIPDAPRRALYCHIACRPARVQELKVCACDGFAASISTQRRTKQGRKLARTSMPTVVPDAR